MQRLSKFDLVYLATPYSKYPFGIEAAFQDAANLAGILLREGVKLYSPITHGHPISTYGGIEAMNHDFWIPFDESMMRASEALLIAMMLGWEESRGISHEVDFFLQADKPVFYLDVKSMPMLVIEDRDMPLGESLRLNSMLEAA